jgi:hypothetical protein
MKGLKELKLPVGSDTKRQTGPPGCEHPSGPSAAFLKAQRQRLSVTRPVSSSVDR